MDEELFSRKMPCQEIKSWTCMELVGAFLDLSITYFLLCASTLAYVTAKFLGLFGLSLPCPCNGLFGAPNRNHCWQRVLVDCPSKNISSVQFCVKSRFPFDSMWDKNERASEDEHVGFEHTGFEGEGSCISFQERKGEMGVMSGVMNMRGVKEGRFDIKGKGISSLKTRSLRCRRKGTVDSMRFSSDSLCDHLQSDAQAPPQSLASASEMVNESIEGSMVPSSPSGDALHSFKVDGYEILDGGESSLEIGFSGRELINPVEENKPPEKDTSYADDLKCNAHGVLGLDGDEQNTIRVLEQALEEEHAARAALYLELEKERSAAATAADEAMAMIMRLQEEKASVEMESRQYQRMIEEKSAYDFEEMDILKEILLRREKEKHFLEKEVGAYRQIIFGNEQLDSDVQDIETMHGKKAPSFLYSGENPLLMMQRINESNANEERVEMAKKFSECEVRSLEPQNQILAFGKELPIPELDQADSMKQGCIHSHQSTDKLYQRIACGNEEINEEFQEKELVSLENSQLDKEGEVQRVEPQSQFNLSPTLGYNLLEKTIASVREGKQQSDSINTSKGLASRTTESFSPTKIIFPYNFEDSEKHGQDSFGSVFDIGSHVHDVHIIDDKFNACSDDSEDGSKKLAVNVALDIPRTCDIPTMSRSETEQDIGRSNSSISIGLPPIGSSRSKPLLSRWRRNSMSAVDYERFKIDNEVGWLRERLRIIQEGREKLNISMGHREKEKAELQLLENIISQLREIRQFTEPGKAIRQASLPPPPCKVMLKKRRWRSVSLEVPRST